MNMNVSLPDDLANFVKDKVSGGRYSSSSEVIRETLRLMEKSRSNCLGAPTIQAAVTVLG